MKSKKHLSFSTKVVAVVSGFLLVVDLAIGTIMMVTSIKRMQGVIQNKVLEVSATAAALLDGDSIKALTKDDHDNKTEPYMKAYNTLSAFKTSAVEGHGELAFIYVVVQREDNKIVFSIDPSDDPGVFLEEETIYTAALLNAFKGQPGFDDQAYQDRWGLLYTGYAPIFGSDKETVKAVACADVWASWYQREVTTNGLAMFIMTFITILLGGGAALTLAGRIKGRLDALNGEMIDLQEDVELLLKDIREPANIYGIDTKDENETIGEIAALKEQIGSARIGLKKYIAYMHKQAYTDQLTGIGNRNGYFEKTSALDEKIKNGENPKFSLVVFDINLLKEVNDSYGHEVGDKNIESIGKTISEIFGEGRSFRIGGDEIAVILEDINEEETKKLIEEFEAAFAKENPESIAKYGFSTSKGYATYDPEIDEDYSCVFTRADKNMYAEKAEFHSKMKAKKEKK